MFGRADKDRTADIPTLSAVPRHAFGPKLSKMSHSNCASESLNKIYHRLRPNAAGVGG